MAVTALILASMMGASVLNSAWEIQWFPGSYFDSRGRVPLQRRAMVRWPGPDELLRLWQEEKLTERQRVALLLGGAAFHDPVLLPAYREALDSTSQRVRQAGIYGYHDLVADLTPNVAREIDDQTAARLGEEMDTVAESLRRNSLLSVWLQTMLVSEGSTFPGWQGVIFRRSGGDSLRAAERLVGVEDLDLLVRAFQLSKNQQNRIGLTMLIEAVSLSRFIELPTNAREAWGPKNFADGMRRLEATLPSWYGAGCSIDGEKVLVRNLRALGVVIGDPLSPEGCGMWINVLARGLPRWWMLAAKRLYACGAPWYELSALEPDSEKNRVAQGILVNWYQPPPVRTPPPRPSPRATRVTPRR
jgi:hypothetical protein